MVNIMHVEGFLNASALCKELHLTPSVPALILT